MGDLPVMVCIARSPDERAQAAAQYDGVGILVVAADVRAATAFLAGLHATSPGGNGTRPAPDPDPDRAPVRLGDLRVDLAGHAASWCGEPLDLTAYEMRVLGCLAGRPGHVWSFERLHDAAWEGELFPGAGAVQSVIKRLRAKLRQAGVTHRIESVRGVGFRMRAREAAGDGG